jgi:hypothetical protein
LPTHSIANPPLHRDNDLGKRGALWCPGDVGGVNIDGPAAADPETGILYVTSRKRCTSRLTTAQYLDVLAYIFSITGSPAGNDELTTDNMSTIRIVNR